MVQEKIQDAGKALYAREGTYRFLALIPLRGADGIMVLGNMQVQKMLVREVLLTF